MRTKMCWAWVGVRPTKAELIIALRESSSGPLLSWRATLIGPVVFLSLKEEAFSRKYGASRGRKQFKLIYFVQCLKRSVANLIAAPRRTRDGLRWKMSNIDASNE
jgi:hypothetical protein